VGSGHDLPHRIDRPHGIARIPDRDQPRSRPELGLEILEVERDVVLVDVDRPHGHVPVGGHGAPRGHVGFVVQGRDHDLVTRLEGCSDRPSDVERQGRHVVAELDLLGARGTEEVGDRRMRLADHVVAEVAGRERAAGIGIHVAVVLGDRVDDPLRHLRPAGPVEERHGATVLLAGEGREFGPQGIDVEPGHGPSGRRQTVSDRDLARGR
jgi:hypothetical protein